MAKGQASGIRQWAALGAAQRLEQIREEQAAIYLVFPELRRSSSGRGGGPRTPMPTDGAMDATLQGPGRRRRRRKMSAEGRKRISDAQKARWARQRANAASPEGSRKKR